MGGGPMDLRCLGDSLGTRGEVRGGSMLNVSLLAHHSGLHKKWEAGLLPEPRLPRCQKGP